MDTVLARGYGPGDQVDLETSSFHVTSTGTAAGTATIAPEIKGSVELRSDRVDTVRVGPRASTSAPTPDECTLPGKPRRP